jgi:hypothetical protein
MGSYEDIKGAQQRKAAQQAAWRVFVVAALSFLFLLMLSLPRPHHQHDAQQAARAPATGRAGRLALATTPQPQRAPLAEAAPAPPVVLPSTLLVSPAGLGTANGAVAAAIERAGACLVPLDAGGPASRAAAAACARRGSSHVFAFTTAAPATAPPGIRVVYLTPHPAHAVAQHCALGSGRTHNATLLQQQVNRTLSAWADHFEHWRLLTRLWDNWFVVSIDALCDANATSGFLQGAPPCSAAALQQLQRHGSDAAAAASACLAAPHEGGGPQGAAGTTLPALQARQAAASRHAERVATGGALMEYTAAAPQAALARQQGPLAWQPRRTVNLLFTFFVSPHAGRAAEIEVSMQGNINNPYVDSVHIFIDGATNASQVPVRAGQLASGRVRVVHTPLQPTYGDLAAYANTHLGGQVAVVMNVDNVFTDGVQAFHGMPASQVIALSRHQTKAVAYADCENSNAPGSTGRNQCLDYVGSFDAFGFVAPLGGDVLGSLRYKQNLMEADRATVAVFRHYGYEVVNPCKDVLLLHNHCSGWRGGHAFHAALLDMPFGMEHAYPATLAKGRKRWLFDSGRGLFVEAAPAPAPAAAAEGGSAGAGSEQAV